MAPNYIDVDRMGIYIITMDGITHWFPIIAGYLHADALELLATESVLSARVSDIDED
jgi:hypothetical protein